LLLIRFDVRPSVHRSVYLSVCLSVHVVIIHRFSFFIYSFVLFINSFTFTSARPYLLRMLPVNVYTVHV